MWLSAQLSVQLNNKWQWQNDGSYRTLGISFSALQYLYRTGLRYNLNKSWSVATGVAYFASRTTFTKQNHEFAKEIRFWEEVNYKTALTKKTQVSTRLRIEQRSFTATSSKISYHAYRYRVKSQIQQTLSSKWAIQVADEYMQQNAPNTWSFDQNRLIINAVYFLNKHTQINLGYMWLKWHANSAQNILTLSFQKTISLHDKQQ
jgi:ribosomal protein S18